MKNLMLFCRNLGDPRCHPSASKWALQKKAKDDDETPLWPDEEALAKLNAVCKQCDARSNASLLRPLKEREIPVEDKKIL